MSQKSEEPAMGVVSVRFGSVDEAEALIPEVRTGVISILSPGREAAKLHGSIEEGRVLRLWFHDAVKEGDSKAKVFGQEEAGQIVEFLQRLGEEKEDWKLFIHCEMGISRSAAVAVFAASEFDLPLAGRCAFLNTRVLSQLVKKAYPVFAFE